MLTVHKIRSLLTALLVALLAFTVAGTAVAKTSHQIYSLEDVAGLTAQELDPDLTSPTCELAGHVEIEFIDSPGKKFHAVDDGALVRGPSPLECLGAEGRNSATPDTPAPSSGPVVLGTKTFTSGSRTFSRTHEHTGTFNAQYTPGENHYVAFSFQVIKWLRDAATGPATASVTRSPASSTCSYYKVQPINYFWHWSCQTPWAQTQVLSGTWVFPVKLDGRAGTATIRWTFQYRVDAVPCMPGKPC